MKRSFPSNSSRAGFSLIELMVVMAIMGVMLAAIAPAFSGLKRAGNVTSAAYDIAGAMEQARAYAMANNTYVFVGLSERDGLDATVAGTGQIVLAAMASKDGTKAFGTNNSNLQPLAKLRWITSMHLEDALPNTGAMTRPAVAETSRLGNAAADATNSFTWTAGSAPYQFSKIIQFDPRGTPSIPSGASVGQPWMEISLVPARGNAVAAKENCAAVVLDGVTGFVRIYRP